MGRIPELSLRLSFHWSSGGCCTTLVSRSSAWRLRGRIVHPRCRSRMRKYAPPVDRKRVSPTVGCHCNEAVKATSTFPGAVSARSRFLVYVSNRDQVFCQMHLWLTCFFLLSTCFRPVWKACLLRILVLWPQQNNAKPKAQAFQKP